MRGAEPGRFVWLIPFAPGSSGVPGTQTSPPKIGGTALGRTFLPISCWRGDPPAPSCEPRASAPPPRQPSQHLPPTPSARPAPPTSHPSARPAHPPHPAQEVIHRHGTHQAANANPLIPRESRGLCGSAPRPSAPPLGPAPRAQRRDSHRRPARYLIMSLAPEPGQEIHTASARDSGSFG